MNNKKYPLVSVVMSVYNGEKYLSDSIKSILDQTYENFEFLIIDDNSNDKSREILKKFSNIDDRIKVFFNNENKGLTYNLNFLINKSKGSLIARMDADDVSKNNRFEKQISFLMENTEVDILGTWAIDIDEFNNEIRKRTVPITDIDIKKIMLKVNPLIHSTIMFKKESLEKINFYDIKYRTSQDYDMYFRAASIGLKFHNLNDYLLYYRYERNYSKKRNFKYRLNDFYIKKNGFKINRVPYYKWYMLLIPIFLGIVPPFTYNIFKKLDPR
ncbi:glycosyltransferase [Marinitoga aeolica]|uniref:Glycosyltransferase n=1 Tax=Marinitoga aeolica TaxID=2809031 RepID=A0ABY8PTV0_9BACT|nr:glycosyltransferase [Marinitoga aeolica]WGS66043.1 glycosyltransferase [Marinitoga aeolica]